MEAISYVNIFETKGLEYLLVLSFLVGFLLLVRYLGAHATEAAATSVTDAVPRDEPSVGCPQPVECPYRAAFLEASAELGDLDREEGVA
jgi:hypothetical protein